jgi:AraC-like DNA-binding protein
MNAVPGAAFGPDQADNQRPAPHYTRRATDDRDEAEKVVGDLYLPNRLDLAGGSAHLGMKVAGLRLGALTAGRLTYGRRVRLRTADAENFHVNIPLRGRAVSRSGAGEPVTTGPGQGLVFPPGAPADMAWSSDCEQLCLMVPRACLEAELEQLLGRSVRGQLTFDFVADLHSPVGRRWRTVLDLLVDELDHPTDLGRNTFVGRHVEGLVLDGLLLGQPHSHSDAVIHEGPVKLGAVVKQAVELLEERPSEPWTTVRLAAEVHLSVRALQEGFRRDLATTPMTYLRQVRLHRARAALQSADSRGVTVGAIASSLGLLHLGRFAAAYRDAFGEAPSDTLNRLV